MIIGADAAVAAAGAVNMPPLPRLTPAQKLAIASSLMRTARRVKAAGIQRRHPDWTPEQVEKEVKLRFFLMHD